MKMIIGAFTLTLAVPAFAQATPAADSHAPHKGMDHSQHLPGKHDCKECCEQMKGKGGKMDCMDKKGETRPAAPQSGSNDDHAGHAH